MKGVNNMHNNGLYRNCYNNRLYYENMNNTRESALDIKDYGEEPFTINIEEITKQNKNYRATLWTGKHLQVALMNIKVGDSIGLEMHPDTDQFIRIEQGIGLVQMGDSKDNLSFEKRVGEDFAVLVPAGKWHNITNIGNVPIKLYTIYAPTEHPKGTIEPTKEDAIH